MTSFSDIPEIDANESVWYRQLDAMQKEKVKSIEEDRETSLKTKVIDIYSEEGMEEIEEILETYYDEKDIERVLEKVVTDAREINSRFIMLLSVNSDMERRKGRFITKLEEREKINTTIILPLRYGSKEDTIESFVPEVLINATIVRGCNDTYNMSSLERARFIRDVRLRFISSAIRDISGIINELGYKLGVVEYRTVFQDVNELRNDVLLKALNILREPENQHGRISLSANPIYPWPVL